MAPPVGDDSSAKESDNSFLVLFFTISGGILFLLCAAIIVVYTLRQRSKRRREREADNCDDENQVDSVSLKNRAYQNVNRVSAATELSGVYDNVNANVNYVSGAYLSPQQSYRNDELRYTSMESSTYQYSTGTLGGMNTPQAFGYQQSHNDQYVTHGAPYVSEDRSVGYPRQEPYQSTSTRIQTNYSEF